MSPFIALAVAVDRSAFEESLCSSEGSRWKWVEGGGILREGGGILWKSVEL